MNEKTDDLKIGIWRASKRRTSILIIRTPTIKKPSEMALGARLLVFGGPLSSRGLKTSLAATSEARNGIVDDELPTVFPLEEKK